MIIESFHGIAQNAPENAKMFRAKSIDLSPLSVSDLKAFSRWSRARKARPGMGRPGRLEDTASQGGVVDITPSLQAR